MQSRRALCRAAAPISSLGTRIPAGLGHPHTTSFRGISPPAHKENKEALSAVVQTAAPETLI